MSIPRPHKALQTFYQELKNEFGSARVVAKAAGVNPASISRILAGRTQPDYKSLCRLAEALGPEQGPQLLQIYLQELIPERMRGSITVRLCAQESRAGTLRKMLKVLPRDAHTVLYELSQLCLKRTEIVPAMQGMVTVMHSLCSKPSPPAPKDCGRSFEP